ACAGGGLQERARSRPTPRPSCSCSTRPTGWSRRTPSARSDSPISAGPPERFPSRSSSSPPSRAWHTIEASRLDDEPYGAVAVVVRPASAQSLADLIFRAFGLSAREREV